jgi:hypothetical protein
MQRILIFLAVVLVAAPAVAGRRCNRTSGYTLQNSYAWPKHGSCWSCHKAKTAEAYNWRKAITTIEAQKIETAAFLQALGTISPSGQGQAYAQGGGYSSVQGEFSSYPVQGQSLYGVQSYASHPLVDINAAFSTQGKLQAQLNAGAHASSQDLADLTSLAYQLESNRQTQIAAFGAIQAVAQGHPPQPQATQFRFNATTLPNGQIQIQPEPTVSAQGQPSGNPGLLVLENRCASCHDGPNAHGKFNLAGDLTKELADKIEDRLRLPSDDPLAMPRVKTADGFGPGEPLSDRELNAVQDLLWGVQ